MKYRIVLMLLFSLSTHAYANQSKIECDAINDFESLDKHNFVMLGEIHGTVEIPELFSDIVCHSLNKNNANIAVMLELPATLKASLDSYMRNDISEAKFLTHSAWSPKWQDGRFSVAMLGLINKLKAMKQKYPKKLEIFLIDLLNENSNNRPKSRYLADNISNHQLSNYDKTLVLTGNYHNRVNLQQGESAATILKLNKLDPLSLIVTAPKGSYWACNGSKPSDCKVNKFDSEQEMKREGFTLFKEKKNWHGVYHLKKITFSPPIRP